MFSGSRIKLSRFETFQDGCRHNDNLPFPLELKATVHCYFCNYGYNNKYVCNMSLSATMSQTEPVDHVPSCPPTSRVTVALTIVFYFTKNTLTWFNVFDLEEL